MENLVELLKEKSINIPKRLLYNYKKLKINEAELIILIFLINVDTYNPKEIADCMDIKLPLFLEMIELLKEKGFIKIEFKNNNNVQEEVINIDGLYEKIALSMMGNLKKETTIYDTFEKELGRTLSPIEYEIVGEWLNENSEEILLLALKEATYNGVSNFRYIDRIVHEWNKKGIKTKEDVIKNNQEFKSKKVVVRQELFDYDWLNDEANN